MHESAINEAAHRRGMVLGFTLAEVLLLLLFLLLLVLGAQLVRLQGAHDRLGNTAAFRTILEERRADPFDQSARIEELEEKNRRLTETLAPLSAILGEAEKLNPNDPPEALKRALDVLNSVGKDTPAAQVRRVAPDMAAAIDEAGKVDSRDPAGAIKRALAQMPGNAASPPGKHDWPPIISLSEADGYFFESGSAELSPEFLATLSGQVVGELLEIVKKYDGVNVVEVVGHTDEQPFAARPSNLDKVLPSFLRGQPSDRFVPSDNAGLGLARAVSVTRILTEDKRLGGLRILPLSGAQLIGTGDTLSVSSLPEAVKQRRRIEIRVRRSDRVAAVEKPDVRKPPVLPPEAVGPKFPAPDQPHPGGRSPEKSCTATENWLNFQCW